MRVETLGTYINDHLAGSAGAIEMVERVIRENDGERLARDLERSCPRSRLTRRCSSISSNGSAPGKARSRGRAPGSPRAGRVKLGGTGGPAALSRLEMLEALIVGMHGRRSLWRALVTVVDGIRWSMRSTSTCSSERAGAARLRGAAAAGGGVRGL